MGIYNNDIRYLIRAGNTSSHYITTSLSGQGTSPDFVLLLKVCLAVLAYGIKANPVERQTDIADNAQEKSKQIQALMADIKGLEATATARRNLEAKSLGSTRFGCEEARLLGKRHVLHCLPLCEYIPLKLFNSCSLFFFEKKLYIFEHFPYC